MFGLSAVHCLPGCPSGRRRRCCAGPAVAICFAALLANAGELGAAGVSGMSGHPASQAATPGPDDLLVKFAYRAIEASRLRLYRGTSFQELATVGEYAIPPGVGQTRFVDPGRRDEFWVYQVRLVDARGEERVLGTIVWQPPRLAAPNEAAAGGLNPMPALLPVVLEVEPVRLGAVPLQADTTTRISHPQALDPPPKLGAG